MHYSLIDDLFLLCNWQLFQLVVCDLLEGQICLRVFRQSVHVGVVEELFGGGMGFGVLAVERGVFRNAVFECRFDLHCRTLHLWGKSPIHFGIPLQSHLAFGIDQQRVVAAL